MRRRLSIVLAVLVAAGCSSYRPVAPLDEYERAELAALRPTTEGRDVALVVGPHAPAGALGQWTEALKGMGLRIDASPDRPPPLRIELDGPDRPLDSIARREGDILFFILTLGLWPQHQNGLEERRFRIADEAGRETTLTSATSRPSYFGWISGPLSLFPGWTYLGSLNARAPSETDAERANRRDRAILDLARALDAIVRAPEATSGAR